MLVFTEKVSVDVPKSIGCLSVAVSPDAYEEVKAIADRSGMKMKDVATLLIMHAVKDVKWEDRHAAEDYR